MCAAWERRQLQMQMNPAGGEAPKPPPSIHVDVNNLELRARNLYTGGPRCSGVLDIACSIWHVGPMCDA